MSCRPILALLCAPLLLQAAGCAVGPRYTPPSTSVPDAWLETGSPGAVEARWWETFHDPVLNTLIEDAARNSLDVRQAQARLLEARAATDAARGGALPQGGVSGSFTRNRLSENGEIPINHIPGFSPDLSLWDGGFDASWEVDLWGRQRRTIQAAHARAQSAEDDRRDTLLRLRAEVARTYFTLRADQAILDAATADAKAEAGTADLLERRLIGGESGRSELARARVQAHAAAAALPGLEANVRDDAFQLAQLAGRRPEALAMTLLAPAPLPEAPETIVTGLRSDMLRRRPDVARAERDLAASTADTGAAVAALFPTVSLIGSIGQQAQSAADLALDASTRYQVGPTLSWPVLQMGTLRANVRAAKARGEGAKARYEAAVLGALEDSESALNRFVRAVGGEREAAAALDSARQAERLARQRYAGGEDDLSTVLGAESATAQASRALTDARLARAVSAVSVFKALGA